jgi:hypothetical protein
LVVRNTTADPTDLVWVRVGSTIPNFLVVSAMSITIFLNCSQQTEIFQGSYAENQSNSTRWLVQTENTCVLLFSWVRFFTKGDVVEVTDSSASLLQDVIIGRYSGDILPGRICTPSPSAEIHFFTIDHSSEGFSAIISSVAPNIMECNDALVLQSWTELAMAFDLSDLASACAVESSPFFCDGMDPPHLTRLYLSGLMTLGTSLPEQISQLKHLEVLEMADMNITGNIPDWLCNGSLPGLWSLNLMSNFLTGQLPDCIWGVSNSPNDVHIEILLLSNNFLSGSIPTNFRGTTDVLQ